MVDRIAVKVNVIMVIQRSVKVVDSEAYFASHFHECRQLQVGIGDDQTHHCFSST
jgi:hypothetical protein